MKRNILFATAFFALLLNACKNNAGESVQEIKASANNSNADMVRNPISADQPLDTAKLARIVFDEPEFNFGQVNEGDIVHHDFAFSNTGHVPLVINNARASCGCTVPEWPQDPIPPGGKGVIKARFNTEAKKEDQRKIIYITANTYPNETQVVLAGHVKPKKTEGK